MHSVICTQQMECFSLQHRRNLILLHPGLGGCNISNFFHTGHSGCRPSMLDPLRAYRVRRSPKAPPTDYACLLRAQVELAARPERFVRKRGFLCCRVRRGDVERALSRHFFA